MTIKDNPDSSPVDYSECISDELMLRYLEQQTSGEETKRVLAHLNQCPVCFEIVASEMQAEIHPYTKEEIEAVDAIVNTDDDKLFKKVFSHLLQPRQITPAPVAPGPALWQRFFGGARLRPAFRYSLAAIALAIILIGAKLGYRYFHTNALLNKAETTLQKNFKETRGATWMASDNGKTFNFSGTAPMAGGEKPAYLGEAEDKLGEAIRSGASSEKAWTILSEIYLIEYNDAALDSLVRHIDTGTIKSAALLNNLGIYASRNDDWQAAGAYFQRALSANPNLLVAKFNLAKAYIEIGKTKAAISLLQEYAQAESDRGRRREALDLIDNLQSFND